MTTADDLSLARSDGEAQRLADGFADHVVRWAMRSLGATEAAGAPAARLEAVRRCAWATSFATSNGHVCTLLSDLAQAGEDAAGLRTALLGSGVVGTPGGRGAFPLILDEEGRLYLHRYFDYEVRLARRLAAAAKSPPRAVAPASRQLLDTLFPPAADQEVDWQKLAAAMALRSGLAVISGGPGTGKTTTVVNLLACLLAQEPDLRIVLAAPTGKAAARMIEAIAQRAGHLPSGLRASLPQESFTIHRLLGANPAQGRFVHGADNPLALDALIVDEASMLDLALATRLLEAVPASARIVLLGDKDQLAAVEAGAVFAELSADPTLTEACRADLAGLCGYRPERIVPPPAGPASALPDVAVWLTRNYRFPAQSPIGRLAAAVNAGASEQALALLRACRAGARPAASAVPPAGPPSQAAAPARANGGGARRRPPDTASLSLFPELDAAPAAAEVPGARGGAEAIDWRAPEDGDDVEGAILAGYRDYFDMVRGDPDDVAAVFRAFNGFRVLCAVREGPQGVHAVNEQVSRHARMVVAPEAAAGAYGGSAWYVGRPVVVTRNDYALRLSNGDIGIALPGPAAELVVFVPDGANGYRSVPALRMPPHETAFAMTTHKAQGSEFERLLLLLPQRPSRVLSRELLYTAITRARTAVTLHAPADVLTAAIAATVRRDSGLRRRLGEQGHAMGEPR